LKSGDSGILEDGDAKTDRRPIFEDEKYGESMNFQMAEPSEADDEGSVMEDIDMSVLKEEHGEENDRIVTHSLTICTL
jgi:hypothetical protein